MFHHLLCIWHVLWGIDWMVRHVPWWKKEHIWSLVISWSDLKFWGMVGVNSYTEIIVVMVSVPYGYRGRFWVKVESLHFQSIFWAKIWQNHYWQNKNLYPCCTEFENHFLFCFLDQATYNLGQFKWEMLVFADTNGLGLDLVLLLVFMNPPMLHRM